MGTLSLTKYEAKIVYASLGQGFRMWGDKEDAAIERVAKKIKGAFTKKEAKDFDF